MPGPAAVSPVGAGVSGVEVPVPIPARPDGQSDLTVSRVLWITSQVASVPSVEAPRLTNTVLPRRPWPSANSRTCSVHHGRPGAVGSLRRLGPPDPRPAG
jgi:hypothetical protein